MNESQDSSLSCSFTNLASAIEELDSLVREMTFTNREILFQIATVDFAFQVLEAAKATLLLQLTAVPRTNWATARLAFESVHDLFYLMNLCPDRQAAGAKIYVGAMIARKRAHDRLRGLAEIQEEDVESEVPGLRDYVRAQALSANVRETRSTQRIRVGRRQRKRTCWDCEREWKRMVVPLEPGRPSEARQLLWTQR